MTKKRTSWRAALRTVRIEFRSRKGHAEPDLRPWEFVVQMLCSAYLSWRWLGNGARFTPWRPVYWQWLAQYSSINELRVRASLASKRTDERRSGLTWREWSERDEAEWRAQQQRNRDAADMAKLRNRMKN